MADTPHNRETDWLLNRLDVIEAQMREQHQRLRSDMNAGFLSLTTEMRNTVAAMTPTCVAHGDRLLVIETERKIEAGRAMKRGTWAGLAAAAGLTGLIKIIEHWFGMK